MMATFCQISEFTLKLFEGVCKNVGAEDCYAEYVRYHCMLDHSSQIFILVKLINSLQWSSFI